MAGNIKSFGIEQVQRHGPYRIAGDKRFFASLDRLLRILVQQQRMKLGADANSYTPCYELVG